MLFLSGPTSSVFSFGITQVCRIGIGCSSGADCSRAWGYLLFFFRVCFIGIYVRKARWSCSFASGGAQVDVAS